MSYFAIKTSLGLKKVPEEDADFYIETIEEYYRHKNTSRSAKEIIVELQDYKKELEQKILELEKERDDLRERVITAYNDGIHDEKELADKERKENVFLKEENIKVLRKGEMTEESLAEALDEINRLESLNAHFIRVAKERANQQNGQSKKDGSGYAVISTGQIKDKIENYDRLETIDTWKTTIKTPYNASLPIDTVEPLVRTDLIDKVLGPMGVDILQLPERNGEYVYPDGMFVEDEETICMVYRYAHHARFAEGVWEIDIFHDKPLFVPEELRAMPKIYQPKKEGDQRL